MHKKILLWDNDGTIMGSKNPNDPTKVILPNVESTMKQAAFNFIISGIATPESESQNFDPEKVVARFTELMNKLAIRMSTYSPNLMHLNFSGIE